MVLMKEIIIIYCITTDFFNVMLLYDDGINKKHVGKKNSMLL